MRYPVMVRRTSPGEVIKHPESAAASITADERSSSGYVIAWSDGTMTCGRDLEKFWANFITGGQAFTELVRETVRDEMGNMLDGLRRD